MSRHASDQIGPPAWRVAILGLIGVISAVMAAALLISGQDHALNAALAPDRIDEHWTIRSGSMEADRLVLQPAGRSIGLALRPIESAAFVSQTRVVLNSPISNYRFELDLTFNTGRGILG